LLELDIVADEDLRAVLHVINAATLTYLAVTLQTILTSLVGMLRYMSRRA
jgi:Zn-dependent membrane protease YugP